MSKQRVLGILGVFILSVGVFVPIIDMNMPEALGDKNSISYSDGDGVIVLFLAGVSLILIALKKYKGLLVTSGISLLLMAIAFSNYYSAINGSTSDTADPEKALVAIIMKNAKIEWAGWIIMLIGAGLLIAAAFSNSCQSATDEKTIDNATASASNTQPSA